MKKLKRLAKTLALFSGVLAAFGALVLIALFFGDHPALMLGIVIAIIATAVFGLCWEFCK